MEQSTSSTGSLVGRATQLIVVIVILVPAIEVMLGSRNLMIQDYQNTLRNGPPIPLMRLATMAAVMLAIGAILLSRPNPRSSTSFYVMGAFAAFYFTNVLLCGAFGKVPFISRSHIYPLIVYVALYLSRDDGPDGMLEAAKVSLFAMMVMSLVALFAMPEITRRVYAPEVRLPFIDFRFWGLGSSANGIAPLGLILVLLTLHRPFDRLWMTRLSIGSGALVVLLAQSQTVWLIAAFVVPVYLRYRSNPDAFRLPGSVRSPLVIAPLVTFVAASAIGLILVWPSSPSELSSVPTASDVTLTGRIDVWTIALNTFSDNLLFGYGLTAWEADFREKINILWAFHAHNQLMQSLSVAGLFGGVGLVIYFSALVHASLKAAPASRGLAPAFLAILLVRSVTEAPLDMGSVLVAEAVMQLLLFRLVTCPQASPVSAPHVIRNKAASLAADQDARRGPFRTLA